MWTRMVCKGLCVLNIAYGVETNFRRKVHACAGLPLCRCGPLQPMDTIKECLETNMLTIYVWISVSSGKKRNMPTTVFFFFHFSALTQSRKSLIVSNILSLKKCYSAFTLCWSFCHTSRCCFEMSFLRFRRLGAFSCLLWHCPDVCDSTLPVS